MSLKEPAGQAPAEHSDFTGSNNVLRRVLSVLDEAMHVIEDNSPIKASIRRASKILKFELGNVPADRVTYSLEGQLPLWRLKRVISYIDAHVAERLDVRTLSNLVSLSPSHFCRGFKMAMGETLHNFIIRRRLRLARTMMLSGAKSLGEIALACGFADQAHFSNRFRAAMGISPASWRKQEHAAQLYGRIDPRPWNSPASDGQTHVDQAP